MAEELNGCDGKMFKKKFYFIFKLSYNCSIKTVVGRTIFIEKSNVMF